MKASTLFALTVALLLGLGAAAGARYAGLFDKKAPPPPAADKPKVRVLVAKTNLFEDVTATADQVMVRDLRPEEQQYYEANKDKFMPALPMAAHLRVASRNVLADQPLLKDYFREAGLPDSISERLSPGYRSVNVSLQKDKAAGGVIQLGEFVDVLLTTKICPGGDCSKPGSSTQTACIAKGCKVVMKRNNLWTIMASNPDDKPVHYTLQANPYRAALIEYAQSQGVLSLQPVPPVAQKTGSFSDPSSREYADEDMRVQSMNRGELTVGPPDLIRIFNVMLPPPLPPPVTVRHYGGVMPVGTTVLPSPGAAPGTPGAGAAPSFQPSAQLGPDGKECKDCDEKKAAREAKKSGSVVPTADFVPPR